MERKSLVQYSEGEKQEVLFEDNNELGAVAAVAMVQEDFEWVSEAGELHTNIESLQVRQDRQPHDIRHPGFRVMEEVQEINCLGRFDSEW